MKDSDFMQTIEQALLKLEKSKFRSSFKLKEKDREYVKNKGMDTVRSHARGCLNKWYRIPKNVELTPAQQEKIVNLLMAWIEKQMKNTPIE